MEIIKFFNKGVKMFDAMVVIIFGLIMVLAGGIIGFGLGLTFKLK